MVRTEITLCVNLLVLYHIHFAARYRVEHFTIFYTGCEVDQVVSLSDLLTSMREKFSPPEEDKVRLFLLEVDELKNIR